MLAANVPSLRLLPDDAHPWNVLDLADPLEGAPPTPTTIPRIIQVCSGYSVSRRIATTATQFTQSIPTGRTACSSIALYTATSLMEGSLVLTAPHHVASAVAEGCWWDQERRQAHPNHPLPPGHLFSPLDLYEGCADVYRRVRLVPPPAFLNPLLALPTFQGDVSNGFGALVDLLRTTARQMGCRWGDVDVADEADEAEEMIDHTFGEVKADGHGREKDDGHDRRHREGNLAPSSSSSSSSSAAGGGVACLITTQGLTVAVHVPRWGPAVLVDSHGWEFGDGLPAGATACYFDTPRVLTTFLQQRWGGGGAEPIAHRYDRRGKFLRAAAA